MKPTSFQPGVGVAQLASTTSAASAENQRGRSVWGNLLTAVINTSFSLSVAPPAQDYQLAFNQAGARFSVAQHTAAEFVVAIRRRLQQADAVAIMRTSGESDRFHSLKRWLPAIPQPLLGAEQLCALASLALGLKPSALELDSFFRLQQNQPALFQLLVDEINQAAARQSNGIGENALPALLRLKVFSDQLNKIHPLLPMVVWAIQVLWQVRRQGGLNTLEAELRIHLHHWLGTLDSGPSLTGSHRHATSDKNLFLCINGWLERRLDDLHGSDGMQPLLHPARSVTAGQPPNISVTSDIFPATAPASALPADGWLVNSALNMAGVADTDLLVEANTCIELLKREMQPLNLAVGCAPSATNRSVKAEPLAGVQFWRSLVLDETGKVASRLQIESGDFPVRLQGVTIPSTLPRPQTVTALAGPGDTLIALPPSAWEPSADKLRQMASRLMLSASFPIPAQQDIKLADRLHRVNNILSADSAATEADSLPASGWLGGLSYQTLWQHPRLQATPVSTGSAWPLSAASAQKSELPARFKGQRQRLASSFTVDDFYQSLLLTYREQLTKYSRVTVTQQYQGEIRDKVLPLEQALHMIDEAQGSQPHLTLNFHPEWSNALRKEIEGFILYRPVADIDSAENMDWQSTNNQQATWLAGTGIGRASLNEMTDILLKIQSPVWDVHKWLTDKVDLIVKEFRGDTTKINARTPVNIAVRLPSSHGRQHIPMPGYAGTLQSLGNYTVMDIVTREYLRKHFRYESMNFIFPAGVSSELKQRLLEIDMQALYMRELEEALTEGVIKQGVLSLFQKTFEHALDAFYEKNKQNRSEMTNQQVREAVSQKRFFRLVWQGERLTNLIFIATETDSFSKGIILSMWDKSAYSVRIDPAEFLCLYHGGKAEKLLDLIEKNMSIKARLTSERAEISDNKIKINTSGYYAIRVSGKLRTEREWIAPDVDKSMLVLIKSRNHHEDCLTSLVTTLKSDMDYLVKSNVEHFRDSAIEVLDTISTLVSILTVPATLAPVAGLTSMGRGIFAAISSWKASFTFTSTLSVFPGLVKAITADRPEEAQRAYIDAALVLLGEGGRYLVTQYGTRTIVGLFRQGSKVIKIGWDKLPETVSNQIIQHAKQVFSAYKREIRRIAGLTLPAEPFGKHYPFSFIDARYPAPVSQIKHELADFAQYINQHHKQLLQPKMMTAEQGDFAEVVQHYLQARGHKVEIGAVASWSSIGDAQPALRYIARVKSPKPDIDAELCEIDDTIIEFTAENFKASDPLGRSICSEEGWQERLFTLNQNKAIGVEWFNTLSQARARFNPLVPGRSMLISLSSDSIILQPDWYKAVAKRAALSEIDASQAIWRQSLHSLEEESINKHGMIIITDLISLKLGDLFAKGYIQGFDAMGKKLNVLANKKISQRPAALPAGEYLLVASDIRGISSDNQGNVTLTNFAAPKALFEQNRIQGYPPDQIIAAGTAAEVSSLYAPGFDDLFLKQAKEQNVTLAKMRLSRLESGARWLEKNSYHLKVPLIFALNSTEAQMENNQINDTFAAEDILFVLAPDDITDQVKQVLAPLGKRPIPVSPLLIDDAFALHELMSLAKHYILLPEFETSQQALAGGDNAPWIPLINLQASAGFISQSVASKLRESTQSGNYRYFLGEASKVIHSLEQLERAEPAARMVFIDVDPQPNITLTSHTVMMLEDGTAIGANNQLIGGSSGWEKIYLKSLNWLEDKYHGLVLENNGKRYRLHVQTTPLTEQSEGGLTSLIEDVAKPPLFEGADD
ncbi:hypothetical protein ACP3TC_09615 [Winslowiella sp. 2C04]|uniref:hypothetical protein n=1 Tax=Winslowiella sp. 2C04 TaxID=3416179 RepID=UPI003CF798EC